MSGIKVRCEVNRYEDGPRPPDAAPVIVESHGIWNDRVRLTVNGQTVTVIAAHLIDAVNNATRVSR